MTQGELTDANISLATSVNTLKVWTALWRIEDIFCASAERSSHDLESAFGLMIHQRDMLWVIAQSFNSNYFVLFREQLQL